MSLALLWQVPLAIVTVLAVIVLVSWLVEGRPNLWH